MTLTYLIFSLICFKLNILFYIFKKKGYSLVKIRYVIISVAIISIISLLIDLPFFLFTASEVILNSYDIYLVNIVSFNLSIFFLGITIMFQLFSYFNAEESITNLDIPSYSLSRKGDIKIGRVLKGNSRKFFFSLSLKDLEKHMFICGSTGTGKSNFLQNFLINFTKRFAIPFFLVEFKGEHHFLQEKINDILIVWPGENFSINIFNPLGSNPEIHAERIFDILKSGKFLEENSEYSPQMEKVLIEVLIKVCGNKNYQSWRGFEKVCEGYFKKNQSSIPMLKQTLISIKNRIRRFSKGPLRAIFESKTEISINDLFNTNVILDLSSIIRLGGEKEDALFFLNMILKYLWDRNLINGAYNYNGIKHLTIIEDAQYFAPQGLAKKSKLTTYLEDIALLQRGTGECLITLATRPDISKEILANNGIVLTFKNHIEKDIMCELLNLDNEKKHYLSFLEEGHCIIRVNSFKDPFLLWVPHTKRKFLTVSEIIKNNSNILSRNNVGKSINSKSAIESSPYYTIGAKVKKYREKINNLIRMIIKKQKCKNQKKNLTDLISDQKIPGEDLKSTNLDLSIAKENIYRLEANSEINDFDRFRDYISNLYKLQEKNQ